MVCICKETKQQYFSPQKREDCGRRQNADSCPSENKSSEAIVRSGAYREEAEGSYFTQRAAKLQDLLTLHVREAKRMAEEKSQLPGLLLAKS